MQNVEVKSTGEIVNGLEKVVIDHDVLLEAIFEQYPAKDPLTDEEAAYFSSLDPDARAFMLVARDIVKHSEDDGVALSIALTDRHTKKLQLYDEVMINGELITVHLVTEDFHKMMGV